MTEMLTEPNRVTGQDDDRAFRKLDVNIRDNDYVAGRSNITAIVIRNTYTRQIKLKSVTARHSTINSSEPDTIYRGSLDQRARSPQVRHQLAFRVPNPLPSRSTQPLFEWIRSWRNDRPAAQPLEIRADGQAIVKIVPSDLDRSTLVYATDKAVVNIEEIPNTTPESKSPEAAHAREISPSSEIVSEYSWRTSHWLLFVPVRIGIDIEIQYEINGENRSQVVSSTFDIKPPIYSIVIGGIVGGAIGNLARAFTTSDEIELNTRFFVKLIGACLLSLMAVVSLSRKSGSQSFITVEDFFGAFVLGSLIGYQGTAFFEKTVVAPATTAPSSQPLTHQGG